MKIAMPLANQKLCMHFGHCEVFRIFSVNEQSKKVEDYKDLTPPPHEPGLLPKWIAEQGATLVLAGGMGQRAQNIFASNGIQVITGVVELDPTIAVNNYLNNALTTGPNACDH